MLSADSRNFHHPRPGAGGEGGQDGERVSVLRLEECDRPVGWLLFLLGLGRGKGCRPLAAEGTVPCWGPSASAWGGKGVVVSLEDRTGIVWKEGVCRNVEVS